MKASVKNISTRDAILDATDRLLARYGYKKMTIDDVARETGIGKGSVYLHFPSKEEIALSHVDRIVERLKGSLDMISHSNAPVSSRLKKMLVERVVHRFDSVQHYTVSLNEMLSSLRDGLLERRKGHFEQEAAIFASVIEEGQSNGTFRAGDARDLARTLLSATNSLLPYSLSATELGGRKEIADRAAKTAEILVRGLAADGAATKDRD